VLLMLPPSCCSCCRRRVAHVAAVVLLLPLSAWQQCINHSTAAVLGFRIWHQTTL
jgi:hypothetical protein